MGFGFIRLAGIFVIFVIYGQASSAQPVVPDENINIKDGIYLSVEEFRNNTPSYPINGKNFKDLRSINAIKIRKVKFGDKSNPITLPSDSILFISLNNTVFINHHLVLKGKLKFSKSIFYKIFRIGRLSRYFPIYKHAVDIEDVNLGSSPAFVFTGSGFNASSVKLISRDNLEYVYHMDSGKTFNLEGDHKALKSILQKDPYFASQIIKSKELPFCIGEFNQRHPVEF